MAPHCPGDDLVEHAQCCSSRRAGQTAAPSRHTDLPAGQAAHGDAFPRSRQSVGHGRGREDGWAVTVEGEGRDQAEALQLGLGREHDARFGRRLVDLFPERGARGGQQQWHTFEIGHLQWLPTNERVIGADDQDDVLIEEPA